MGRTWGGKISPGQSNHRFQHQGRWLGELPRQFRTVSFDHGTEGLSKHTPGWGQEKTILIARQSDIPCHVPAPQKTRLMRNLLGRRLVLFKTVVPLCTAWNAGRGWCQFVANFLQIPLFSGWEYEDVVQEETGFFSEQSCWGHQAQKAAVCCSRQSSGFISMSTGLIDILTTALILHCQGQTTFIRLPAQGCLSPVIWVQWPLVGHEEGTWHNVNLITEKTSVVFLLPAPYYCHLLDLLDSCCYCPSWWG